MDDDASGRSMDAEEIRIEDKVRRFVFGNDLEAVADRRPEDIDRGLVDDHAD
ncbi:hypothetical protein MKK67_21955 [Methylobacterium sp. J-072]|nr:hypothetical protein [Methylobacterium sp. J-072]MCJ2095145.1 hypothetical protein [Methylobacterium sp. J-072]